MSKSLPTKNRRRCCGGSVWRNKATGTDWLVQFCHKASEGGARMVAYTRLGDRNAGGVMWESDFREQFDWVRGTPA